MSDTKENQTIEIGGRKIGRDQPVFIIAEMSANHNQDIHRAKAIIRAAQEAGVDAIKLQTYTADTMTLALDGPEFRVGKGLWDGQNLHTLYQQAYTPWEWHEELFEYAMSLGLVCFSTPFDFSSVDFLETLSPPAYKIASPELVDIPLIERVAATGKPMIISTGMANLEEIGEAVNTARHAGAEQLVVLKCTSAYPAHAETINLRSMPELGVTFGCLFGLSDHSMGHAAALAAVALGASVIEKHFTLSRSEPGPDSAFSMEPEEMRTLVENIRFVEAALGTVAFGTLASERDNARFRRSLYVVESVKAGEVLEERHIKCIRPACGLHPRHYRELLGRRAARDLEVGTPLSWADVIEES